MSNNEWVVYFINSNNKQVYYESDDIDYVYLTKEINKSSKFSSKPYTIMRFLEDNHSFTKWKTDVIVNIKRKQKLKIVLNKL